MTVWQVTVHRQRDPRLTGRESVHYDTPATLTLEEAHALIRVLLDVDELGDLDGPWETAIVGGRQVIELVTFPDTLFPTEEPA